MRKSNMLKVLIAFFLILIFVFFLSVFLKVQSNSNKNETYISNNVINDSKDAKKIIQSNKNVIIYFSQKNCVYCKELNSHLNNLDSRIKENLYVFYIENEDKELVKKEFDFSYTPTLIYYRDSIESDRLDNDLLFKNDLAKFNNKGETELKKWLENKKEE
ncbi:thioredoxin family protein [Carnobacterium divergens]|uniref:Thioredoxin family protein n=1 Tax=Carnobacterium divergens TaxID=2748 RepID=A0AAW8RA59_CARDV|nr:thioredoxin family protein [Carnobacterium divergens]MDT1958394.1 thioredoxin family protein [Carnobacterium divergens]MDT1974243.1 thioredoxin family protein [Carnobacterium divergens]